MFDVDLGENYKMWHHHKKWNLQLLFCPAEFVDFVKAAELGNS